MIWPTFIREFSSTFKASVFTPDAAITVTRIQVQMANAPAGCSVNARIRLSDGTTETTLTLNNASEDSGPLALDFAAGVELVLRVNREATCQGSGNMPKDANVIVQYKVQ